MVHCVYKWHCYVCYLLQHRGFTTMHYMNLRINYLLTCDVMHSRIWFIGLGRFGYFNFGSVWFSYQSRILSFLWSPYGIGQTIIFSSCRLFVFFFPRLISAVADWMSTILPHMVWPECEFKMQVWNLLHAARLKTQDAKKSPKITIWAPSHNFVGYIFAIKACIDNRKKTC